MLPGLIFNLAVGHNDGMVIDQEIREPPQFSLRSLFVATLAVAAALGIFRWFGPVAMILSVQCAAVIAVLALSRGSAWQGVVFMGSAATLSVMLLTPYYFFPFVATFGAWVGGGIAADTEWKRRALFLRWSGRFAVAWLLTLVVIGIIAVSLDFHPGQQ